MAFMRHKGAVLVVDDSPEIRKYFQTLLELNSYTVKTANDGMEALELLLQGFTPEIVLLDIDMPELDGLATLERIRMIRPEQKVIMCSGQADPWYAHRALALGAEAYLVKPVRHLYLTAALERCLTPARKLQHTAQSTVIPFRVSRTC
ncbi:MAG TPA: response regulator [Terriglobales bacterium]|nr:response regulator [Terriglobales bacterium]